MEPSVCSSTVCVCVRASVFRDSLTTVRLGLPEVICVSAGLYVPAGGGGARLEAD